MPTRALLAALLLASLPALAEEQPRCKNELVAVQKSVAETPLSPNKTTQVNALLEQVRRACQENNDVVAMAGIDQVRAILDEVRKS
jgi:CRISPR/Cas system-associated endoribonuclease Cas2